MIQEMDRQNDVIAAPERLHVEKRQARRLVWFLVPILVLAVAGFFTLQSRAATDERVAAVTKTLAIQHVSVVHPVRGSAAMELSLPGTMEAFNESPVFARTSGYLKCWAKDIGSRVSAGEVLAVIETPELDQQLLQARGMLAQTEANLKLAKITAARYQNLIATHSVSQQNLDQANQNMAMLTASQQAGAADVQRLEQMQSFEQVRAPFGGIVTARSTDIGDLINAGNGGMAQQLFRVARIDTLRVFVNVPEDYVAQH